MNTLIIIAAFVLAIYVAVVIAVNKQIPNSGSYGVHMGAAIACGALSQICVTVTNPWFLLA